MGAHHQHAHGPHEHGRHDHAADGHTRNEQRVGWAALLTGGFMLVEAAGGLL